jgi:hypothetical protein
MLSPERKDHLTASVCGAVLGRGKFKSRTDVLRDKVKALLGTEEEQGYNPAFAHGNANEHVGVEYAMQFNKFGKTGENQEFIKRDIFGVTPDGVYVYPDGKVRLLEVKAPYKQVYTAEEVPLMMPEYYDNMQLAMWVADAVDTMFVVVSPDGTVSHHIFDRDDSWMKKNEKELRAFWGAVQDSVAYSRLSDGEAEAEMVELQRQIDALTEKLDKHKSDFKKQYKDGAVLGRLMISTSTRAGAVDWEAAFAKHGINAEEYRKRPTRVTKILIDTTRKDVAQ